MNIRTQRLVFAATFLALALILPFITGNNRQLGTMFSLMHIPVLLCGFICGWQYGLLTGAAAPLLRSVWIGMPPMPVVAVPMAFELAVYGLAAGLLYKLLPKKSIFLYIALICAMVIGRFVNLAASFIFGTPALLASLHSLFVGTLPGTGVQIVIIPVLVMAMRKAGLMPNAAYPKAS